jgi:hypothetical protein
MRFRRSKSSSSGEDSQQRDSPKIVKKSSIECSYGDDSSSSVDVSRTDDVSIDVSPADDVSINVCQVSNDNIELADVVVEPVPTGHTPVWGREMLAIVKERKDAMMARNKCASEGDLSYIKIIGGSAKLVKNVRSDKNVFGSDEKLRKYREMKQKKERLLVTSTPKSIAEELEEAEIIKVLKDEDMRRERKKKAKKAKEDKAAAVSGKRVKKPPLRLGFGTGFKMTEARKVHK